jgi:hypothetical protein
VRYDWCYARPTTIASWRGVYSLPALGWSDTAPIPTVAELLTELRRGLSDTFSGWKGGDYTYGHGDELRVDNPGEAGDTGIAGVLVRDHDVIIQTGFLPW